MANKSDELATKEMPFRCYVGYDSHEDITFEVRTQFSFRFPFRFLLLSEEEEEEMKKSRAKRRHHQSVASPENDLSRSLCNHLLTTRALD